MFLNLITNVCLQSARELHSVWSAKWKTLRYRLSQTAKAAKASGASAACGVSFNTVQAAAASASEPTLKPVQDVALETTPSLVAQPVAMTSRTAGSSSVFAQSPVPTPIPETTPKFNQKAVLLQNMRDIDVDSVEHLLFRVLDIGLSFLRLVDINKRFETHVRTLCIYCVPLLRNSDLVLFFFSFL